MVKEVVNLLPVKQGLMPQVAAQIRRGLRGQGCRGSQYASMYGDLEASLRLTAA